MFVIVVTSNVFGETPCYNLIFSINLHCHYYFFVSFVFIIVCCVLKFFTTFSNYCKCGVNSCVSTTKLLMCQSSLLQLVIQLLFMTYFNAPFQCCHGSYLLRAFTLCLQIVCFCFLFGLCLFVLFFRLLLLMDEFLSLIFIYKVFFYL